MWAFAVPPPKESTLPVSPAPPPYLKRPATEIIEQRIDPETMLLPYLRKQHILSCYLRLSGTKYGCGEGGCGSCTVMISTIHPISKKIIHFAANACLLPVCSLHGTAVTTVEGIGSTTTRLHPVQERIAKAHGSQCGFCSPGIVMSIYALLRNHPEPTMDQIYEALGGNLCRCTGYRPIVESCKTFCKANNSSREFHILVVLTPKYFQIMHCFFKLGLETPLGADPTLCGLMEIEMVHKNPRTMKQWSDEKLLWYLMANIFTNCFILMNFIFLFIKEVNCCQRQEKCNGPIQNGPLENQWHTGWMWPLEFQDYVIPCIMYHKKLIHLAFVLRRWLRMEGWEGISVGAACTLSMLNEMLYDAVSQLPEEKTKIFRVLLQQLKTLAGQQIRNVASLGGHIISRNANSDLNPVLAAGNASLYLMSKGGSRHIPCNDSYFQSTEKLPVLFPGEVLVSVLIPYSQKLHELRHQQAKQPEAEDQTKEKNGIDGKQEVQAYIICIFPLCSKCNCM
ncbi:aldehyde oxidase [Pelobates cultripes]|uniref:Aldehyde oxidase n=1 Tax=Pelobates cultripes TaxID=61616 RepID=A0AAD1WH36_PELCU|nr:aldehyde oxidase [Pelobates cultripes]